MNILHIIKLKPQLNLNGNNLMSFNNFFNNFLEENGILSVTDKTGKIIYVNDKFCKISKYSRADLIGANHRIIRSGFHSKYFFRTMWKTISKGKTWQGNICNRARDGSLYWVKVFIRPELDSNGKVIKYYSFRTEITDRKNEEEQKIIHTVEKLRALWEKSQGFQFFIDYDNRLVSFNKSGAEILELKIGRAGCSNENNPLNFNTFLPDFDANLKKSMFGEIIKLEQEIDFYNDGKERWFLITYSPVEDSSRKIIGVSLTAIDIHKRKEAELALKLEYEQKKVLIEFNPDPIYIKDGKGKWRIINSAAHSFFKMENYEWVGKTDSQMGIERPQLKVIFENSINNDEITWTVGKVTEATEFIKKDGSMKEIMIKKHPIFHKDGRRKALIIQFQNISEHKLNLEKLKKQSKQLNRIAWLQAHKARAPVARILGLVSIFNLNNMQDPINREVLNRLLISAHELDDVIHRIIDYAEVGYL